MAGSRAALSALLVALFALSAEASRGLQQSAGGGPQKFSAVLAGHAFLPASTFQLPPRDAPYELFASGKYADGSNGNRRVDVLGSVQGTTGDATTPRYTGVFYPFAGQPVQGLSGIKSLGNGTYMQLQDNGFGNKAGSPDLILQLYIVKPDFKTGAVKIQKTIWLHDPDRVVPFLIKNEYDDARYLTGSDFDPESFQPVGDKIYIGDEFGPYILAVDFDGKVVEFYDTVVPGLGAIRSPDNDKLKLPDSPAQPTPAFEARRSKGYEGMAQSPDGKFLYPLLEGALYNTSSKAFESANGKQFLRIFQFDLTSKAFTGKSYKYALEDNSNSIGDFNMIDANRGLIIERDNGEGDATQGCPAAGPITSACFNQPALFKRIYLIDMAQADSEGFVKKVAYLDLLDISDPNGVSRVPLVNGKFTFPFVTIEDVDIVDSTTIIIANDNNLPFSSGRQLGKQDNNEYALLTVTEFLKAM